jgi:hypothetical protein
VTVGYNTTVIVMNDFLDDIAKDPEFGKKLAEAIEQHDKYRGGSGQSDVSAGGCVNAASVVETHHADFIVTVEVGGNTAKVIGQRYDPKTRFTEPSKD